MIDPTPNPLRCHQFQQLLDGAIAGRSTDADRRFLDEHRIACPACAEAWDRRAALLRYLANAGRVRVAAPAGLDAAVTRAGDAEELVRLLVSHLPPMHAPAALDERILVPVSRGEAVHSAARRAAAGSATSGRSSSSRRWLGSPALRIAAGLLVTAGAAYVAAEWLAGHSRAIPAHQITKRSAEEIPAALRPSMEFLAGGLPGSRKG